MRTKISRGYRMYTQSLTTSAEQMRRTGPATNHCIYRWSSHRSRTTRTLLLDHRRSTPDKGPIRIVRKGLGICKQLVSLHGSGCWTTGTTLCKLCSMSNSDPYSTCISTALVFMMLQCHSAAFCNMVRSPRSTCA